MRKKDSDQAIADDKSLTLPSGDIPPKAVDISIRYAPRSITILHRLSPEIPFPKDYSCSVISPEEFHILPNLLGRGYFNSVYYGLRYDVCQYQAVAIKFFEHPKDMKLEEIRGKLRQEAAMMSQRRSPYLVRIMGMSFTEERDYLLTEYVPEGALGKRIEFIQSWKERYRLALDISLGLMALHQDPNSIVHGDLCLDNILVFHDSEGQLRAKIGDFGHAKANNTHHSAYNEPLVYLFAPEVRKNQTLVTQTDIYALDLYSGN